MGILIIFLSCAATSQSICFQRKSTVTNATTMSTTAEIEKRDLCDTCMQIQDLDLLLGYDEPIKHHRSWTLLCQSAESRCKLCNAFVHCQDMMRSSDSRDSLSRNFDEHMSWPDTQLTLRQHGINSLFILQQKALFHHPYRDVANVWFELCPKAGMYGKCSSFKVPMLTCSDDPLEAIFTARAVELSSQSDKCLDLQTWIKKCKEEHPLCSWTADHILPTRVIDVGSESEDPFLFESNGARGEWLTLSHCWGGGTPLQTTSRTLDIHKSSITMDSLPETFRDAILLTRLLGY